MSRFESFVSRKVVFTTAVGGALYEAQEWTLLTFLAVSYIIANVAEKIVTGPQEPLEGPSGDDGV